MDRQIIDIVDLDIDDASKVLLVEDCLVQGGNPSDEELSKLFWLCLISLAVCSAFLSLVRSVCTALPTLGP